MPATVVDSAPGVSVRAAVDAVVPALMARDRIPGMAVGVTVDGKRFVVNYGVASKRPQVPVNDATLFELGSVSKTFTATAAALAQVEGRLSLSSRVAAYLPAYRGTAFGNVTLLSLGTHTPGGMALQVPDAVTNEAQLTRYLQRWRPSFTIGTHRTYSNQSIGMLGVIAARCMSEDFASLMHGRVFGALGLQHTFIMIPKGQQANYAWGYTGEPDTPIRLKPGMLWQETYGVRSTAGDMIRFVQENIDPSDLAPDDRRAIEQTHTGYYRARTLTQDLIWEQYRYPVALSALLDGNSYDMIFRPTPVTAIVPPEAPAQDVWIDKTGSTNGFATYVAFVPSKRIGIVLLANKNYAIPDRVRAAYAILSKLVPSSRQRAMNARSGAVNRLPPVGLAFWDVAERDQELAKKFVQLLRFAHGER